MKKSDKIRNIARKYFRVKTLITRNMDSLDFYEVPVWNIKNALEEAFEAGANHNKKDKVDDLFEYIKANKNPKISKKLKKFYFDRPSIRKVTNKGINFLT